MTSCCPWPGEGVDITQAGGSFLVEAEGPCILLYSWLHESFLVIEFPKTVHSVEITGENWRTASKVYSLA